jgi:hypothetical protein
MAIPLHFDVQLGRREGAGALTEAGYTTAPATLATLASRGGGPIYRRYGSRAVYRWGDLLDWARSRLSAPMRSTSDADAVLTAPSGAMEPTGDLSGARPPADIGIRRRRPATPSSDRLCATAPAGRPRLHPAEATAR